MTFRWLLPLAGLMLGCSADPLTELVVVVNSDMFSPDEFDGFRVVVTGNDGSVATDRHFFLGEQTGKVRLPADFGITPRDGDAGRRVTVEVWATHSGGALFSTRAVTGFVQGKVLRLDMYLARRCLTEAQKCQPNETCRIDGCGPEQVDPVSLPEFDPELPLQPAQDPWLFAGGSSEADIFLGADIDSAGNVFFTGMHAGDLVIGDTTYPATTQSAVIGKFASTGKVLWSHSYSADTLAWAVDLAASPNRLYAAGWYDGQMRVGAEVLDAAWGQNSFLFCYDHDGTLLWTKNYGDLGNVQVKAVAVAPNGNVALTGLYPLPFDFGGPPLATGRGDDVFVAVLDRDGKHIFSRGFGGEGSNDTGWAVAFDSQSNVVIGGTISNGEVDFGGTQLTTTAGNNAFVAKYRADGSLAWAHTFENSEEQFVGAVAINDSDHVIASGAFSGSVDFGGGGRVSAGDQDIGIVVLDSDGTHLHSTLFGSTGPDAAHAMRVVEGKIIVGGEHSGDVAFNASTILAANNKNAFVLAISPDLSFVHWSKSFGGDGADSVNGLAAGSSEIAVTGSFEGTFAFESLSAQSNGLRDGFLLTFPSP